MHAYAAKCPPQLVKFGGENFSQPYDLILDPMVGSGITLIEACLSGRNAFGFDIDPLSCLIAKVKSTLVDAKSYEQAEAALVALRSHPQGAAIAQFLNEQLYHNFEPAQWRSERKRHYRYPGQSPLQVAGPPPGKINYLDALGV
jgi:hypothetical protein